MSKFIKCKKRYVDDVKVTDNGVLVFQLDMDARNAQEFSDLEADMFLALIQKSIFLPEKEKRRYKIADEAEMLVDALNFMLKHPR